MHPPLIDVRLGSTRERLHKGRLVMLGYPVVAVAAAMILLNGQSYGATKAFLAACLLYPVVYFVCLDTALVLRMRRRRVAALVVSGLPLQYVGAIALLAIMVLISEGTVE